MFTQRISMDCTKEQYEKFLKEELLKMGYIENGMYWGRKGITVFTNAANGITGGMLDIREEDKEKYNRTYLGSFNAPLFLALAAMTDNPNILGYGEYITDEKYKTLRRNDWGKQPFDFFGYHKSTKNEIIDWFKTYVHDLNESPIYFHRNQSDFNDGLRIQSIDLAIKILKSNGYKILKPKTWEEI